MIDDQEAERLRRIVHLYGGPRGDCADNHPGEPCGYETIMCRRWSGRDTAFERRLSLILASETKRLCRCGCEREVAGKRFFDRYHRRQLLDTLTAACELGFISLEQAQDIYAAREDGPR